MKLLAEHFFLADVLVLDVNLEQPCIWVNAVSARRGENNMKLPQSSHNCRSTSCIKVYC
jgi:hypothetical protein